jgi:hypothetical protein
MSALRRVTIIIEAGRIVGTQIAAENEPSGGAPVAARLRAGPEQTLHEVQIVVPADLARPGERERFHASLLDVIRGRR